MKIGLQRALELHEGGDLEAALAAYQGYLSAHPEDVDALRHLSRLWLQREDYRAAESCLRRGIRGALEDGELRALLGDALLIQGRIGEAIACYCKALTFGERRATVWNNLGLAMQSRSDHASAETCYTEALKVDPEHAEALYNLGLLCYERDDYDAAIGFYERALAVDPIESDVLNNLGNALYCVQRLDEALVMYRRALEQEPDNPVFLRNLQLAASAGGDHALAAQVQQQQESDPSMWVGRGMSLQRRGDRAGAIDAFRRALALNPEEPTARHLLRALVGDHPDRADTIYIEELFDDYAPRFEGHLVSELGYQVPALMRWILSEQNGPAVRFASHLDLGCGTGLVGAEMRDIVDRLVGIDLSGEMLQRCASRSLYDALHKADFVQWLRDSSETFELITAADAIIYLGDLQGLFAGLYARLRPGGWLLFSTERLEGEQADFFLRPTGRFAHSRAYLRRLAAQHGFEEVQLGTAEIRRKREGWELGDIAVFRRPPAAGSGGVIEDHDAGPASV